MHDLLSQDLLFSLRKLARRPAFTVIALLTLAVGVGANTAIFSIVNAVVLKPLPYSESENLVDVRVVREEKPDARSSLSQVDVDDILAGTSAFEDLAGYQNSSVTFTSGDTPEVLSAGGVTDGLLDIFRLTPLAGRDLTADDNVVNGPRVVVISESLANSHLGGSLDVVGDLMTLDGENYEIVGIAPSGFDFPSEALLWVPLYTDTEGCGRGCRFLTGIGRLAEGADEEQIDRELSVAASRLSQDYPEDNLGISFDAMGLQHSQLGDARRGLLLLLGAVGLVLFVAAANLASLQIARATERRAEISIRAALGANRFRLCSLILTETVLLGVGGALLGLAIGEVATRSIVSLAPEAVPRLDAAHLDLRVLLFALTISLGASLLFALIPAWRQATGPNKSGRRTIGDRSEVRSRRLLLVGEVALSMVLLVGAGLLLRTYDRILNVDLGFQPNNVYSFFIATPDQPYDQPEKIVDFYERLEQELARVPGVESVGATLGRPFDSSRISASFTFLDQPEPPPGKEPTARFMPSTPGYHATLEIPLLEGRLLQTTDRQSSVPVAVVSAEFVKQFGDGRPMLGRQVALGVDFGFDEQPRTIVGIVSDTRTEPVPEEIAPTIYIPQAQMGIPWMSMVVETERTSVWPELSAAVQRVDPNMPLRKKETLVEAVDRARGPARFYLLLLASFAGIAVFLAAIGLYGVLSYIVARRTREIAVRLALGASSRNVFGHFLGQGLRPVGFGIVLGLVASLLATRLMTGLLYNVEPTDPAVYLAVSLCLGTVAVLAIIAPALRAGKIEPARALNDE